MRVSTKALPPPCVFRLRHRPPRPPQVQGRPAPRAQAAPPRRDLLPLRVRHDHVLRQVIAPACLRAACLRAPRTQGCRHSGSPAQKAAPRHRRRRRPPIRAHQLLTAVPYLGPPAADCCPILGGLDQRAHSDGFIERNEAYFLVAMFFVYMAVIFVPIKLAARKTLPGGNASRAAEAAIRTAPPPLPPPSRSLAGVVSTRGRASKDDASKSLAAGGPRCDGGPGRRRPGTAAPAGGRRRRRREGPGRQGARQVASSPLPFYRSAKRLTLPSRALPLPLCQKANAIPCACAAVSAKTCMPLPCRRSA